MMQRWLAASALVAGCSGPQPLLPPATIELPGQLFWEYHYDNAHGPLVATADRVVVNAGGQLIEVDARGHVLPPTYPDTALLLAASDEWVAISGARADTGVLARFGPEHALETVPFAIAKGIAAGPDGVFVQTDAGAIWSWTGGTPQQLAWTVPPTFLLISADADYLYGDDDGPIVRYARASGMREVIVERDRYAYASLVRFEHRANRLMYRVDDSLFVHDLATATTARLGGAPGDDYLGGFAVDATHAFYGAYRYRDGASEELLGAPDKQQTYFSALVGDQIAWVAESPTGGYDYYDPYGNLPELPVLFIASADAERQ